MASNHRITKPQVPDLPPVAAPTRGDSGTPEAEVEQQAGRALEGARHAVRESALDVARSTPVVPSMRDRRELVPEEAS
jgi:hypothetical protein